VALHYFPFLIFLSLSQPTQRERERERERVKIPPKNFPFRSQFSQHNHEQRIVSPIFLLSKHIFSLSFFSIFNTCVYIYTHTHIYKLIIIYFLFFSDYLFKLLLIGDSSVGKSCLLLRFAVSLTLLDFQYVSFRFVFVLFFRLISVI
jgi:hypothetical protein